MNDTPDSSATTGPGGLWADSVREFNFSNLSGNLAQLATDRSVWTALFLVGCAILLIAIPLYLAIYAKAVKRFHASLATAFQGKLDLTTNAFGFPLYPITVKGAWKGMPVELHTVQRHLYQRLFPVDTTLPLNTLEDRPSRVFTLVRVDVSAPPPSLFFISRSGWKLANPPQGWSETMVDGWVLQSNNTRAVKNALLKAAAGRLNRLDDELPGLTVGLGTESFRIKGDGPLRSEAAALAVQELVALCQRVDQNLRARAVLAPTAER